MDSALAAPMTVPTEYDPLLAKLIAWGPDRATALARARRAAREMIVAGVPTSLPFHSFVLAEPDFQAGRYDTDYVATHWDAPRGAEVTESAATAAALAGIARLRAAPRPAAGATTPWAAAARSDMRH
jgi:acetyl/propionyl-CoA carboxylase alpha subunit